MKSAARTAAVCGVFGALALALLLAGGMLPPAAYIAPALAGAMMLPVYDELGGRAGGLCFAAVGLLALLLCPDKEGAVLFCAFLGWYPLAKPAWDALRPRVLRLPSKLAVLDAILCGAYWLMLRLAGFETLRQDLAGLGRASVVLLLVLGDVAFVLLDIALARLRRLYRSRLRRRLLGR